MRRLALLLAFSVGPFLCGGTPTHADVPPERPAGPPQPQLTPELAKQALLGLMRTETGKPFDVFKGEFFERMAKIAIEKREDGKYRWTGVCTLDPAARTYRLFIPRPEERLRQF